MKMNLVINHGSREYVLKVNSTFRLRNRRLERGYTVKVRTRDYDAVRGILSSMGSSHLLGNQNRSPEYGEKKSSAKGYFSFYTSPAQLQFLETSIDEFPFLQERAQRLPATAQHGSGNKIYEMQTGDVVSSTLSGLNRILDCFGTVSSLIGPLDYTKRCAIDDGNGLTMKTSVSRKLRGGRNYRSALETLRTHGVDVNFTVETVTRNEMRIRKTREELSFEESRKIFEKQMRGYEAMKRLLRNSPDKMLALLQERPELAGKLGDLRYEDATNFLTILSEHFN